MRSIPAVVVFLALVFAAAPSVADVTVKMTTTSTTGGMTVEVSSVSYVKGMKGRMDVKGAGQDLSILQDVAAKQQLMVNHVTKLVETSDPKASMANMGDPTVSVKPSGQTKEILGRTCTGYMMIVSIPMTVGEETFTITNTSLVWLAKGGADVVEWQAFSKAAAAAGILTGSFMQGPQGRGAAELQKLYAENGIPFETEMQLKIEGNGPMAQKMAQRGNVAMTMKVTAISTDPIPDDVFVVPAGYTKK